MLEVKNSTFYKTEIATFLELHNRLAAILRISEFK